MSDVENQSSTRNNTQNNVIYQSNVVDLFARIFGTTPDEHVSYGTSVVPTQTRNFTRGYDVIFFWGMILILVFSTVCAIIYSSFFIHYAYKDKDHSCQIGTRGGINLSDWGIIGGSISIANIVVSWIIILLTMYVGEDPFTSCPTKVWYSLYRMYMLIWYVWGVVILATNQNNQCVVEGIPIACMAIISVANYFLFVFNRNSLLDNINQYKNEIQ